MTTPEARIVRCPNCGGDVAAGVQCCGYCHAKLATVRCHGCYQLSHASAVHCSGCGRELGLEPVGGRDERDCPTCSVALTAFRGNGGVLLDCSTCGGQFVEHALLGALLEEREVAGFALPKRVERAERALERVRYLPCPACRALMNRRNFGGESGVVVDVCHTHGTWFDAGELPRVLAFVEAGGLTRARAREREKQHGEDRARRVALVSASGSQGLSLPAAPDDLQGLASAAIDLWRDLAQHFGRRAGG